MLLLLLDFIAEAVMRLSCPAPKGKMSNPSLDEDNEDNEDEEDNDLGDGAPFR